MLFKLLVAVRPYQGLSQRVKQPYEPLDQTSMKRPQMQLSEDNNIIVNGEIKYEDVEDKKNGKYENIETKTDVKYEDVEKNEEEKKDDRQSKYDSGGYLVATPSMIKRTEEEKIRLRKLKEMGDKIDEGNDNEGDNDNPTTDYADVESNYVVKTDDIKSDAATTSPEKPYLRLVDVSPSKKESKLW